MKNIGVRSLIVGLCLMGLGSWSPSLKAQIADRVYKTFDWFAFNGSIISKYLTGKRKAIAIDPSYIPKSGKTFFTSMGF